MKGAILLPSAYGIQVSKSELIPQWLFWTIRGHYPYRSLAAIQRRPFSVGPLSMMSLSSFVNKAIYAISILKLDYKLMNSKQQVTFV